LILAGSHLSSYSYYVAISIDKTVVILIGWLNSDFKSEHLLVALPMRYSWEQQIVVPEA
jgi:hypothetical protein